MGFAAWFDKNFLMIGLVSALSIGLLFPAPGEALSNLNIRVGLFSLPQLAIILIFFVSGATLDPITKWKETLRALLIGGVFVLFVTPLMVFPVLYLRQVTDVNKYLLEGMALFCAVPTTLSSGVAMVGAARGNVALALILTTTTNLLGVFTMPWSMSYIFEGANVTIDSLKMMTQLVYQTLTPFLAGLILRSLVGAVASVAKKHKKRLTKLNNCCIFFIVWLMTSGSSDKIHNFPGKDLAVTAMLACIVHIVYRFAAYWTAEACRFPAPEWVAFVLMCSQKSLPMCVSVLEVLPPALQAYKGTMIVPCIMSHFSQLMIDGALAQRWTLTDDGYHRLQEKLNDKTGP